MKIIIFSVLVISSLIFGNTNSDKSVLPINDEQGKEIFKNNCASCHTGGFKGWVTGAPEIGELEEWKESFEKNNQELVNIVFTGANDHELKGGCDACTKDQIRAAIEYIMSKTK